MSVVHRGRSRGAESETRDLAFDLERKLHEEREAFLAAISDHVAAPLTAVTRLAELLGDRTRDSSAAVYNNMIESLAIQAREVEHVAEDVMAAARLDLGKLELGSESVNLREAVEAAIHDWEQAQRARLTVTGDLDARGDARWVTHIV